MREAIHLDTERLDAGTLALDSVPFNEALSREGLAALLSNPNLGRVLIFGHFGYLVLTFGFSLEFGGRDVFVDEFFIAAPKRGQGLGSAILEQVSRETSDLSIKALHLEVDDSNSRAEAFCSRHGFQKHGRRLMTRWLV